MKIVRCSSPKCDAPIVWVVTANGHRMPLDAEPKRLVVVDEVLGGTPQGRVRSCYTPHHATCKDVEAFREKAEGQAELALKGDRE